MSFSLTDKIQAEHRVREFLRVQGLPQPDEVEYGSTCVRLLFHESKTCIVFDLVDDDDDDPIRNDMPDRPELIP